MLRDKFPLSGRSISPIFRDSAVISMVMVLSSILGLIHQGIRAYSFGTSIEMDAYLGALAVPSFIIGMIPTVMVSLILPSISKLAKNRSELRAVSSTLFLLIILFSLLTLGGGAFASRYIIKHFIPDLPEDLMGEAARASVMLWAATGLYILVGFLRMLHHLQRRFRITEIISILTTLGPIVTILTLSPVLGIQSMALGLGIGVILQIIILIPGSISYLNFSFLAPLSHSSIIEIFQNAFPSILSMLPFTLPPTIIAFWASKLEAGSISYLGYSLSIATFLSVFAGYGVSTVTFPEMTTEIELGESDQVINNLDKRLRYVLLLSIVPSLLITILRVPLLTIILQRGSFNELSVQGTASVLPYFVFSAVLISNVNLMRNWFYSSGFYKVAAYFGIAFIVSFFLLSGFFIKILAYKGIGLSFLVVWIFYWCISIGLIRTSTNKLMSKKFLLFFSKVAIIALLTGVAVSRIIEFQFIVTPIQKIIVGSCLGLFVFIILSKLIALDETKALFGMMAGILR